MIDPNSRKHQKWQSSFDRTAAFHQTHEKWPVYDRSNPDDEESVLGNWCYVQRKLYRQNKLEVEYLELLIGINFNFEGKADNWDKRFEEISALLREKKSVSKDAISQNDYSWIIRHWRSLNEGKLSGKKLSSIKALHLEHYFPSWEKQFSDLKAWCEANGKLPTRKASKELHNWMISQRNTYKNGYLSPDQISQLESIGFKLIPTGKQEDDARWLKQLENYKNYLIAKKENPRLRHPDDVFIWVQTQRAVAAGNMANRLDLADWRKEALNKIGFKWHVSERWAEEWAAAFEDFKTLLMRSGIESLTAESSRSVYTWLRYQLNLYKSGKLSPDKEARLRQIGFNFNLKGVVSSFDADWRKQIAENEQKVGQHEFEKEIAYLNLLAATDRAAEVLLRLEHHTLQNILFGKGEVFKCAFCGDFYPRGVMAAAHIKKRSECSEEERRDFNVIIPACKFGCDELFEKGYIAVEDGMIRQVRRSPSSPKLEEQIERLTGRPTAYFTPATKRYFDDHYSFHLDKNLKSNDQ